MDREYLNSSEVIEFDFDQNRSDFIVDEIGIDFTNRGNFLILKVQKVEMTTWDMIAVFAKFLNINAQKIGYAGLKDKHATTTQHISIEAKYENALKKFNHKQIKILSKTKHKFAIRMGDLVGNRFKINLFGLDAINAGKIDKLAKKAQKFGVANYFGYQRFGHDALAQAKEMIEEQKYIEDAKVRKFLISVYQSKLFNDWLKHRVLLTKEQENSNWFKLLNGDIFLDLTTQKLFTHKKLPIDDFLNKKVAPTGLLCGRDVFRARSDAREIEKKYDDGFIYDKGHRRLAIIFPKDVTTSYSKDFNRLTLEFSLPKGSYATVFLESISNRNLKPKKIKKSR